MFYCMFYFTCDRSCRPSQYLGGRPHSRVYSTKQPRPTQPGHPSVVRRSEYCWLGNKFPGDFQDTFNKVPARLFTLIQPLKYYNMGYKHMYALSVIDNIDQNCTIMVKWQFLGFKDVTRLFWFSDWHIIIFQLTIKFSRSINKVLGVFQYFQE